jgi:hypothetical protein
MKRITLLLTAALVMALMMVVAGPASATIHPLANSECSNENASEVPQSQDPPGLTPGGPDQSRATIAQPVISVLTAQGPEAEAFNKEPSPTAPIQEYCPDQR